MGRARARWAAIGAAVAVSLGFGGLELSGAVVDSGERPVVVTIDPCRLLDLRPAPHTVGPRPTALGQGETYTVDVHGTQGECTIPTDAVGIVANATIVSPSADGFLTFFPGGGTRPGTSNLNWRAGDPPTPNQVTVDLSDNGRLSMFNFAGTVQAIVDIVAYTVDHHHDDRYHTRDEADERFLTPDEGDAAFLTPEEGDGLFTTPAEADAAAQVAADGLRAQINMIDGGNGEGVGGTICSDLSLGIEILINNAFAEPVDRRFSYIVPEFGFGQIRADGSIRSDSGNLASVEHPGPGQYCLVFDVAPGGAREATIIGIHAES